MKTLAIIDTFGFFFRSFYAMPKLKSRDGEPTGVLMGFATLINQLYNDTSTHLVFALEGEGDKIRKEIASDYKANRQEADPELIKQIKIAIEWISKMGLPSIAVQGYEADDAIASLNFIANSNDVIVKIVSSDKDLYQLIDANTYIYDPLKKKDIREAECLEKFGVLPSQFVDYQSLVGDSSDNVAGVKGIGAKGAQKLITHFGSLDELYSRSDELEQVVSKRIAGLLLEGRDSAYKSRELVRLRENLLSDFALDSALKPAQNPLFLIRDELERYNINILGKIHAPKDSKIYPSLFDMDSNAESTPETTLLEDSQNLVQNHAQDSSLSKQDSASHTHTSPLPPFRTEAVLETERLFEIIAKIPQDCVVAFDTETDGLDTKVANIIGFSFAAGFDVGYYVPLNHSYLGVVEQISKENATNALKMLFTRHIVGHNLKFDIAVVRRNFGLDIENYSDTMILSWLYDSAQALNLDYQAAKNLAHTTIKFDSIVKKGENFGNIDIQIATKYAAEDAITTLGLYLHLLKILPQNLLQIAKSVEFPFIKTLIDMESRGISVDREFFTQLKGEISARLEVISGEIYKIAGESFNINSTQQLGEILFNKLGLKKGRTLKNKGHSTDEKTLESLKNDHAIIAPLLEYREINKLLSTYIVPMLNLNKNGRIYTSFLQTGTSTGRLSSRSPNLQNIPVKTELGRKIRYGFIAKSGYKLLSADYSQIELRLLAHFSQDSHLLESFRNDKDIHLETATRLFGADMAESKRNIAKSINFGLIYGMGARKLAQTLGISQAESKEYMDSYFRNFPTIREFLSQQENEIIQNGYAKTLLGRVRVFDFNNVREYERKAFLREGINSIFQGSAADLIKLSMNECFRRFKNRDVAMLLQVHDELIFEIKESEVEAVAGEIRTIMDNIYTLNVPLKCGISIGSRWSELK